MPAEKKFDNWADDEEEDALTPFESPVDENGIKTVIDYYTNKIGQTVKVTKKIRCSTNTKKVVKRVAERRKTWVKFGVPAGIPIGQLEDNITMVAVDPIHFELAAKDNDEAAQEDDAPVISSVDRKCRNCGRIGHWTARCPFPPMTPDAQASSLDMLAGDSKTDSSYVPPHLRPGAKASTRDTRDGDPTLRVNNLSEDVTDDDLYDLFSHVKGSGTTGRVNVSRVYIARDKQTNEGRGFGFVTFKSKADAQAAMNQLNGLPYDHLILQLEWAKPSQNRFDRNAVPTTSVNVEMGREAAPAQPGNSLTQTYEGQLNRPIGM